MLRKIINYQPNPLSPHRIQKHEYRILSLEQANALLPVVLMITQQSKAALEPVKHRLNNMVPADPRNAKVKQAYLMIVNAWSGKMERLGLKVFGLWQLGFDGTQGWYAWQYPQRSVRYFIEFGNDFEDRCLISDLSGPHVLVKHI